MGKHFALPPAKSRTGRRVLVLVLIAALTVALLVLSGIGRAIAMNILIPLFGPGEIGRAPVTIMRTTRSTK